MGKDETEQQARDTVPNANDPWIHQFATLPKPGGHAAPVMANPASDAPLSEADRRLVRVLDRQGVAGDRLSRLHIEPHPTTLPG